MRTPFLALLALAFIPFQAHSEMDPDKECAQAVMGFLKSKNVIGSGEEGLCLSDLESMPAVNIGLGSKTFPKGQADTFTPSSTTKKNIQSLKEIFASTPGSSFAFAGYADGLEYTSNDFDKKFLGDKSTFTKTDVMNKLSSDQNTMKAVVEKLSKYSDTEEIPFNKDPSVTSLIRNHYLAEARARAVCEVTMGQGCNENAINGFASPNLEAAGHKECGPRRRAVIQINGSSFSGKRPAKDGILRPSFSIPDDAEERRDMQLAAGLNLFQRLKTTSGSSDPEKYESSIEAAIPKQCQKDPEVRSNVKDNFRMMLDHTKKMAEKSKNSNLKSAVFSGDYLGVKKQLNNLLWIKETRNLSESEQADMDLIDTTMTGYSNQIKEEVVLGAPRGTDKTAGNGKGYFTFKLKRSNGEIVEVKGFDVLGEDEGIYHFVIGTSTFKTHIRNINFQSPMNMDEFISKSKSTRNEEAWAFYKDYPNASLNSPSTDSFNCLSSAAAIEDHMSDEGHKPMLIEASTLVAPGNNDVSIEMPLNSVPKIEKNNRTYRGWVCSGCNSGIQLEEPNPNGQSEGEAKANPYSGYVKDFKSLSYKSRDPSIHVDDSYSSMVGQKSSKELTLGSMKNLSVYNISRSAFGDKCPDSKSVCDCLKDIEPGKGELDRILASEATLKVPMGTVASNKSQKTGVGFKAQTSVADAKNHCMFIPPVPHSCKVDPQGQSKDRSAAKKEDALSCQLFAKIKLNFPDFDSAKASTYAKIPLGGAVCKKSLPTTDEGKDCGITIKKTPATGGATAQ